MLTWSDGDVYDIFLRSYEISYEHLGQVSTVPLIPKGEDIPVTNENRRAYVAAYVDHYVNKHVEREFRAFQKGFEKICGGEALKVNYLLGRMSNNEGQMLGYWFILTIIYNLRLCLPWHI